ncbi:phage baseplate assembly protein V [Profundibacterium mesophilum]|uniref:Phage baseplate assembly protein n=1 Tax=Profundibacterium mesophilum KAUST100406-0324 TaxID=1037889 RepID=A0A921TDF0_9RHOB|nr:phage baseplate assembly protein V [Profundibacterium mesophilum]KAF0676738.1 Phage baseplate assembly protein [Profundibacterium mesophilum KAUST100406-0324]
MSFAAAEADRRIANIVQIGTVTAIDGQASRAAVAIGDLTTTLLPVMQLRMGAIRLYAMPAIGEQVTVLAPGGDLARALIGPSIAASNAPGDGDPAHAVLDLGAGELRITGDLILTGKLVASDDVIAGGISLKAHKHGGVATGAGKTGEPV